ncbi:hypothetical protein J4Q44_G00165080 [Coregonus suidteri]|uniref:Secreted protein n=1 Tax=Coregonus suidteri TaxID=861788 RepID=A0AAN8QVP2_9TELE
MRTIFMLFIVLAYLSGGVRGAPQAGSKEPNSLSNAPLCWWQCSTLATTTSERSLPIAWRERGRDRDVGPKAQSTPSWNRISEGASLS